MRYLFSCLAVSCCIVALSACTIEQKGANTEAEFHEPFTYQPWKTEQLANAGWQAACAVSSGNGGLTFVVRKAGDTNVVSVQVNRWMPSGTWVTVTANGNRYETSMPYFSAQDAVRMAEDFSAGGKAYLEASELRGNNGRRARHGNVIKLAGFKQQFDACLR